MPLEYYDNDILMKMGNAIGQTLMIDRNTLLASREKYARLCVEVDLLRSLVLKIFIGGRWQRAEDEGLGVVCFTCGKFGNSNEHCGLNQVEREHATEGEGASLAGLEEENTKENETFSCQEWLLNNISSSKMLINLPWSLVFTMAPWYVQYWRKEFTWSSNAAEQVITYVREVHDVLGKFQNRLQYTTTIAWKPPNQHEMKINIDVSVRRSPDLFIVGGVLKENLREWKASFVYKVVFMILQQLNFGQFFKE
ncbi:hypothetical protein REPUB_Repub09cG0018400 [Reevesia pubescens]